MGHWIQFALEDGRERVYHSFQVTLNPGFELFKYYDGYITYC